MSSQTINISLINNQGTEFVPFAVVPFDWMKPYSDKAKFKLIVPQQLRRSEYEYDNSPASVHQIMEASFEVFQMDLGDGINKAVYVVCTAGAEHFIEHPQVATYPEGRRLALEKIVKS